MILRDEYSDGLAFAEQALRALVDAGLPDELAKQVAIAAGFASVEKGWGISELHFHLARLLDSMGQGDHAAALLERALPEGRGEHDAALKIPAELFPLLRSGVLRSTGEQSWRLDAKAIASPGEALELSYARLFGFFAGQLITLWQETDGRGRLELAGLPQHARKFSARKPAAASRCREWRRDLEEALELQARELGWSASPSVVFAEPI